MKALYKVVADEDGVLKSAMSQHLGEASVTYEVGKWSKPKIDGSKLFCFQSMKKAREFIKDFNLKLRLFRCKAKNPKPASDISAVLDLKSIMYFWGKADKPVFYIKGSMPSIASEEIMLTKEIKP